VPVSNSENVWKTPCKMWRCQMMHNCRKHNCKNVRVFRKYMRLKAECDCGGIKSRAGAGNTATKARSPRSKRPPQNHSAFRPHGTPTYLALSSAHAFSRQVLQCLGWCQSGEQSERCSADSHPSSEADRCARQVVEEVLWQRAAQRPPRHAGPALRSHG
jgi:hypothetical protein